MRTRMRHHGSMMIERAEERVARSVRLGHDYDGSLFADHSFSESRKLDVIRRWRSSLPLSLSRRRGVFVNDGCAIIGK